MQTASGTAPLPATSPPGCPGRMLAVELTEPGREPQVRLPDLVPFPEAVAADHLGSVALQ